MQSHVTEVLSFTLFCLDHYSNIDGFKKMEDIYAEVALLVATLQ